MIHLYCGKGKGKSTAAIGCAVRARGEGMSVKVIQFFKETRFSGERKSLESLGIECKAFGDWTIGKKSGIDEELFSRIKSGISEMEVMLKSHDTDMIVLDEITHAINLDLVSMGLLIKLISNSEKEVILTGRDAPSKLVEIADYVTEMREVKHPYEKGVPARRGIEY